MKIGAISGIFGLLIISAGCTSTQNNVASTGGSDEASYGGRAPAQVASPVVDRVTLPQAMDLLKAGASYLITCAPTAHAMNTPITVEIPVPGASSKILETSLYDFETALKKTAGTKQINAGMSPYVERYGSLYYVKNRGAEVRAVDFRADLFGMCAGNKDSDGTAISDFDSNSNVTSVVGPYVSTISTITFYSAGAAHPLASTMISSVNVEKPIVHADGHTRVAGPANLMDLVHGKSLLSALKSDAFLIKRLGAGINKVQSMDAMFTLMTANLTGCDISTPEDLKTLMSQFAIYDYAPETGKVSVRLAFGYGCEAMRGNLTQLGLVLTPQPSLKQMLDEEIRTAKQENRKPYFMKYMPRRPYF